MKKLKIGIVGIGLIGGSLLKSLSKCDYSLYAVSASESTIKKALGLGLAHFASIDFCILKDCDVVFITTPMNTIIETIDKVIEVTSDSCIITDAGSLKGFVLEHVAKIAKPIRFIGGHPMAGTENKGIDSAQDNLFNGSKWVITPTHGTYKEDIEQLSEIIEQTGAKTIVANAYEHDKAVALISHMPMVLGEALFSAVSNYSDENIRDLAMNLAASGFRDMTRLAMTNPEMAKDMIDINGQNIVEGLNLVSQEGLKLLNEDYFNSVISVAIDQRKSMYSEDGKNTL